MIYNFVAREIKESEEREKRKEEKKAKKEKKRQKKEAKKKKKEQDRKKSKHSSSSSKESEVVENFSEDETALQMAGPELPPEVPEEEPAQRVSLLVSAPYLQEEWMLRPPTSLFARDREQAEKERLLAQKAALEAELKPGLNKMPKRLPFFEAVSSDLLVSRILSAFAKEMKW